MSDSDIDIPSHVPPALVRTNYPFRMGQSTSEHPFKTFIPQLHEDADIVYTTNAYPIDIPMWLPRKNKDIQAIYLDTEHFSSANFSPFGLLSGGNWNLVPAEIDPPNHTKYRALLTPLFTPPRMKKMDATIRQLARDIIAEFKGNNSCDFMRDFAQRFPIAIFLDLMGMPQDRMEQFLIWEKQLTHSMDFEDIISGTLAVVAYLEEIIEERRANPGDDLVSFAVTAEVEGRKLNYNEVMGLCFNLYIGGLDTVTTNLGWQIRHLAENPKDQQKLREDPSLIANAVENLYRRYPAVTTFRTCTKETTIAGVTIMPGDKVAMSTTLANTDPDICPPDETPDITKAARHLTFGYGIHRCAGAPLARRESVIAIEELLMALPNFKIEEGVELKTAVGPILQSTNLPLTW